jgi:hypothetical protein
VFSADHRRDPSIVHKLPSYLLRTVTQFRIFLALGKDVFEPVQ